MITTYRTEHQLAYQHGEFMTSLVYIQMQLPRNFMVIKRMHKQCVPDALSPSPTCTLCLGTRLA